MPYTAVTLETLLTRLAERSEAAPYWTQAEGRYAFNESLRTWNMLTSQWRKRETLLVSGPAAAPWLTLPGAMAWGARMEWDGVPMQLTSLYDLDCFRPRWRSERTSDGGSVPTVPTHWAPGGVFRIALWPSPAAGFSGTLTVDGLQATPVLSSLSDTIDLNESEQRVHVGYAFHYQTFKQGGKIFTTSTAKYYKEFLAAAVQANDRLLLSAFFRREMGRDLDSEQRPIIRRPRAAAQEQ